MYKKQQSRMVVQAAFQPFAVPDSIGNAMIFFSKWIVSINS